MGLDPLDATRSPWPLPVGVDGTRADVRDTFDGGAKGAASDAAAGGINRRERTVDGGADAVSGQRPRMTAEEIMAFGRSVAALPLLDERTPAAIMDDLNAIEATAIVSQQN